jgi:1,4-alpha-glucan branching enzyme
MIKTTKPGRDGMIRVTFSLPLADPSGPVSVVGEFNEWDPHAHPLRKRANQTRSASVSVPQGSTIRFRYLGEGGVWFDDETVETRAGWDTIITV